MSKTITKAELAQHKDAKSIWIAIHDKVYDITKFLEEVRFEAESEPLGWRAVQWQGKKWDGPCFDKSNYVMLILLKLFVREMNTLGLIILLDNCLRIDTLLEQVQCFFTLNPWF